MRKNYKILNCDLFDDVIKTSEHSELFCHLHSSGLGD